MQINALDVAQQELFNENLQYAKNLVYKYPNVPRDDAESIAYESLLRAVEKYDPERHTALPTYLTTIFNNAMTNYLIKKKQEVPTTSLEVPISTTSEGEELKLEEVVEDISSIKTEDITTYNEIMQKIKEELDKMDSRYFGIFEDRIQGKKWREIAPTVKRIRGEGVGINQPLLVRIFTNKIYPKVQEIIDQSLNNK